MHISAIVPAYNEDCSRLNRLLNELNGFVGSVVVVDDGSNPPLNIDGYVVLRHKINRGQGAALQTGTDYVMAHGAEIIIHFDADGQHSPEDIPILIKPILDNTADFVFGSRFLGAENNMPWSKRYFIHPIAMIISRIFTGLQLSDVHNGLRAFSSRVAAQVYLKEDRMAHNSEYSYLVKKHKIKYSEVPVKVIYNEYGQGIGQGLKILKELILGKILK